MLFVYKKSEQDFVPVHLYDATILIRYYPEWDFFILFFCAGHLAILRVAVVPSVKMVRSMQIPVSAGA